MHLFYCCAKDENFRQLIGFDSLGFALQPFLSEHGSRACFLALLSLSFFINNDTPEQQKRMLKLEKSDVLLLKLHLAMKQITLEDALHLVKSSTLLSANVSVLHSSDIQSFVSQFLDDDDASTREGNLAAEIITSLQSVLKEDNTELPRPDVVHLTSPEELLESFLPLLGAYNTATAAGDSSLDLEACIHIFQKLQSLKELLGTDTKQLLQSISRPMLETAARELSRYIKLHLMGKLRLPMCEHA